MFTGKDRQRAFYLLFFLILILVFFLPFTEAMEKTFPLEKVKPGMKGYGCTVFSGTKIERFDVKVLALVDNNYNDEKLVLVQLAGKEIEASGGLAAGMSGSPVYINNRLLGAISYGFENADSSLALVTPIDTMFKLFANEDKFIKLADLSLKPVPVTTPVIISGMRRRGYELMANSLERYGLKSIFVPSLGESNLELGKYELKPGSAIAVLMVSGDYQVSAIGTVTMVEGKSFLAFGHPYTNRGNVNYFAYQANILHTVKSPVMSFKIGVPGKLIGRITQDRQAGILGKLTELPEIIPVQVNVKDLERNFSRKSNFYVADNDLAVRDLIISGVTDAIDQTIDRVGSGSATIKINIKTRDIKTDIHRENFYNGQDIAVNCQKDLRYLLDIIYLNDFIRIKVKNIQVDAEISDKQVSARVGKIITDNTKVKPGGTLKVKTIIHTYRGENSVIPFEVKLPANIKPGKLTITIYGGSKDLSETQREENKKNSFELDYKNADSSNDLIDNYLSNPGNNELILEYTPEINSKGEAVTKNQVENENKPIRLKYPTGYYLTGESQINIEVEQL